MEWTVTFYSENVRDEIFKLPPKVQAKLIREMEMVKDYGPTLGLPHVRMMGDGLNEIRAKARMVAHDHFFAYRKARNSSFFIRL